MYVHSYSKHESFINPFIDCLEFWTAEGTGSQKACLSDQHGSWNVSVLPYELLRMCVWFEHMRELPTINIFNN